jgi:hypothetical protein
MTFAEFGSLNPHPVLPFWLAAATPEQTPAPVDATLEQHALEQSASATQPPVMNCAPLPAPTFLAPALFGVTCAMEVAATMEELVMIQSSRRSRTKRTRNEGGNSETHIDYMVGDGLRFWFCC